MYRCQRGRARASLRVHVYEAAELRWGVGNFSEKAAVSFSYGTAADELHVSCDIKDFILAGQAIRHFDRDDLVLCRADECAAERRFVGNLPLKAVGFCGADDGEFKVLIIFDVMDHDLAADVDRVRACLFLNEDFRVLQDFFLSARPWQHRIQRSRKGRPVHGPL